MRGTVVRRPEGKEYAETKSWVFDGLKRMSTRGR
jgi:hypothetical protein